MENLFKSTIKIQEWQQAHKSSLIVASDFAILAELQSQAIWEKADYCDMMNRLLTEEEPLEEGTLEAEGCQLVECPICKQETKYPDEQECYLCYRTHYDRMNEGY